MLKDLAVMVMVETPGLRYFLGQRPRGQCGEGICECLPPFRGALCDLEDPPRQPQQLKAVIHYMMAETVGLLRAFRRSISSLRVSRIDELQPEYARISMN